MAIVMSKAQLRREILRKRDHQTDVEMQQRSDMILRNLFTVELVNQAEDVLLYSDFGSEVRTEGIFQTCKRLHKRVYYPRVEGADLVFYRVEDLSELRVGFRGIREPFMLQRTGGDWIYAAVVLVPGTVFSLDGYRIGYGRGFYDRFLAHYPTILKIGLAYETQLVDKVPVEPHDVRLDGLITEKDKYFW